MIAAKIVGSCGNEDSVVTVASRKRKFMSAGTLKHSLKLVYIVLPFFFVWLTICRQIFDRRQFFAAEPSHCLLFVMSFEVVSATSWSMLCMSVIIIERIFGSSPFVPPPTPRLVGAYYLLAPTRRTCHIFYRKIYRVMTLALLLWGA